MIGERLNINWEISDGYYLYKDRISASQNNIPLDISFLDAATEKEDEFFGRVQVFQQGLSISMALQDNSPVILSFQGCAEKGLCYPPVFKTFLPDQQGTPFSAASYSSVPSFKSSVPATTESLVSAKTVLSYITDALSADNLAWKLALSSFLVLAWRLLHVFSQCFQFYPAL